MHLPSAILLTLILEAGGSDFSRCSFSKMEVNATAGSTVLLPCHFPFLWDFPTDGKVLWQKQSEGMEDLVVYFQYGRKKWENQSEDYANRTSMLMDWVKLKDATLELQSVRVNDSGEYVCWVTRLRQPPRSSCKHSQVSLHVEPERRSDRDSLRQLIVSWALYLLSLILILSYLNYCRSQQVTITSTT